MITLVYETHSTTEDNLTGTFTGWLPGRLTAEGRDQARELGARRRDVDVVVHSDLGRAVETATIAFAGTDAVLLADWRLRECDYGELNGTREAGDRIAHLDEPYPGGESWRAAVERNQRVLPDLLAIWDTTTVLLIGHAATRFAMLNAFDSYDLDGLLVEDVPWRPGWEYELS